MANERPLIVGWLTKRGSGFPFSWRTRYFVLFGPSLCVAPPDPRACTCFREARPCAHPAARAAARATAHAVPRPPARSTLTYYATEEEAIEQAKPRGSTAKLLSVNAPAASSRYIELVFHDNKGRCARAAARGRGSEVGRGADGVDTRP